MKKSIPASNIFTKWRQDPEYVKEYDALEDEFSAAEALIEARKRVELSQDEVATLADTSQSTIATLKH
jgi:DNA-binding transcriptional regulator YiaG